MSFLKLSIKKYYFFCHRNRLRLQKMIFSFEKEQDPLKKKALSKEIMDFAIISGAGFFTIPEIENFYLDLAKKIDGNNVTGTKYPDSFLHVMTKAYPTGGHSRVVARWINSSSGEQKHSVILLNQESSEIPYDIQEAVKSRNGVIYVSKYTDLMENASYLRMISNQYTSIILHIHPNDPTPIIAYGIEDFKTPIILFNHADHNYWCGSSVVDVVADIRDNGITRKYRNIRNTFLLRIPIETNLRLQSALTTKIIARKALGIPQNEKVILTVGRSSKYEPIGKIEFCQIISSILNQISNSKCYGIGPTADTGNWGTTPSFVPLGEIEYGETYFKYLSAADLYIDSLPIGGGTSVVDAVQAHVPVLAYTIFNPDFGSLVEGVERQNSRRKFVQLAASLLNDKQKAIAYAKKQYDEMNLYHGENRWNKNLDNLIRLIRNEKHKVNNFKSSFKLKANDQCVFLAYERCPSKERRKINASSKIMYRLKNAAYCIFDKL